MQDGNRVMYKKLININNKRLYNVKHVLPTTRTLDYLTAPLTRKQSFQVDPFFFILVWIDRIRGEKLEKKNKSPYANLQDWHLFPEDCSCAYLLYEFVEWHDVLKELEVQFLLELQTCRITHSIVWSCKMQLRRKNYGDVITGYYKTLNLTNKKIRKEIQL